MAKKMPKKSSPKKSKELDLVKGFLAAQKSLGIKYFTQTNADGKNLLYVAAKGQNGVAVGPKQLQDTIRKWLVSEGEVHTAKQLQDLTKSIISNVPAT